MAIGLVLAWGALLYAYGQSAPPQPDLINSAHDALVHGEADRALRLLDTALSKDAANPRALNLRCRVLLSEDQADKALPLCAKAVQLAPQSSETQFWLGRVYGLEAQHAPVWKAYGMAGHVRDALEAAYRLDPRNVEAASDLGAYYVEAPKALGGGDTRAQQLADQLAAVSPTEAHELRAHLAEHTHDQARVEAELGAACDVADRQHVPAAEAGAAWIALARYYQHRNQNAQMVDALKHAVGEDPAGGPVLVKAAGLLMRSNQEPALAESWLRRYLQGQSLSEDAPAFRVHVELAALLAREGRQGEAEEQMREAHELASVVPLQLPHGSSPMTASLHEHDQ